MHKSFAIARVIAALMLIVALGKHPYGYYTLLRFVVCGVGAYGAYISWELKKNSWIWVFGVIAFLFNPLVTIYLGRELWAFVDVAVAIILLLSLISLNPHRSEHRNG